MNEPPKNDITTHRMATVEDAGFTDQIHQIALGLVQAAVVPLA